jgi:hypothetical protein
MILPRRFHLERDVDVTGVSGTGTVAHGVMWPDGTATVRWATDRTSTQHWDRISDGYEVHTHGGNTRLVWDDPAEPCPEPGCEAEHDHPGWHVGGTTAWDGHGERRHIPGMPPRITDGTGHALAPARCGAPAFSRSGETLARCDREVEHTGWHGTESSIVEWSDPEETDHG